MEDDCRAGDTAEPLSSVMGGSKPVHRFFRGEPKSIGIALVIMGICLFLFGITMKSDVHTSADLYSPFWLGILFALCGLLYILSERSPTKKIITASFALSIVSTIGTIFACVDFLRAALDIQYQHWSYRDENHSEDENLFADQHYMLIGMMERVFFCHSLMGGVLIITMTCFARAALRSSRTQAVVVMHNLSSVE